MTEPPVIKMTTHDEIMGRLRAYVEEDGTYVDLKRVAADIIVLMKADDVPKVDFMVGIDRLWDEIEVQVVYGRPQ